MRNENTQILADLYMTMDTLNKHVYAILELLEQHFYPEKYEERHKKQDEFYKRMVDEFNFEEIKK